MSEKYEKLLTKTYDEAVTFLLNKYGPAKVNYFSEKSYNRFKSGEIKTLTKGKVTRTTEGLYCHHIDENKIIMISNPKSIKFFDIPYKYQEKERLVYCDLIEHGILHVLIAIESQDELDLNKLGVGGYLNFIRPELYLWLIEKKTPTLTWQKNCYNKIKMNKKDAIKLLATIDSFLVENYPISQHEIDSITTEVLSLYY